MSRLWVDDKGWFYTWGRSCGSAQRSTCMLLSKTPPEYLSDPVASLRYLLTIDSDYFLFMVGLFTRQSDLAKSAESSILKTKISLRSTQCC